jgi:hypothetical protein
VSRRRLVVTARPDDLRSYLRAPKKERSSPNGSAVRKRRPRGRPDAPWRRSGSSMSPGFLKAQNVWQLFTSIIGHKGAYLGRILAIGKRYATREDLLIRMPFGASLREAHFRSTARALMNTPASGRIDSRRPPTSGCAVTRPAMSIARIGHLGLGTAFGRPATFWTI